MNSELDLSLLDHGAIYIPLSNYSKRQNGLAYAAYRSMFFRKNHIWIEDISKLNLDLNDKVIYFHSSIYIPQFSRLNYSVELIQGKSLFQYLMEIEIGSYVAISVKDDGSQQIKENALEEAKNLGITLLDNSKLRYSYVWLARKIDEKSYEVIHQECSCEELSWEGQLGDNHISIKSGGANGGNYSSIIIDGVERSKNSRGMNIVSWENEEKVISTNFDTFSTIYMQGSLFKATPSRFKRNDARFSVISHAGGMFEGLTYTNCEEAIEWNYRVNGHRIFEIDFELTSDGELVARHNWQSYLYDHLQQKKPEGVGENEPLSLEQFKKLKVLNKYSPLTISDIYKLMTNYPDINIVTDTKYLDADIIKTQFERMISAVEPYGYELLLRIVPQLYSEEMYSIIEEIFPFPRYIYTLYATQSSDEQILRFVENKPIMAVTTYPARHTSNFGGEIKKLGIEMAIHTINDVEKIREYANMNVDGFYTDTLSTTIIKSEIAREQTEVEVYRDMLFLYIEKRFGTVPVNVLDVFNELTKQELKALAPKLFLTNTLEEFNVLLEQLGAVQNMN